MQRITLTASALIAALLASAFVTPVLADEAASTRAVADPVVAPVGHTLTVTVTGVRSAHGRIMAGLLKADAAEGIATAAGGTAVQAVEGNTVLTFSGLTEGDYAVRLFHDENGDGEMSTNLFGMPTEGFGFSNGARARFGPPAFSDMKVEVRADATTTAVMSY